MRRYSEALWCVRKHISLAMVHIQETLQKISRERGNLGKNLATREECDYALQNLIAVGEHAMEVISKSMDGDLKQFMMELDDEVRHMRQRLVQTGLPFRDVSIHVSDDVSDVLAEIYSALTELVTDLDTFASRMSQEQFNGSCVRCKDDFGAIKREDREEPRHFSSEDDELCG